MKRGFLLLDPGQGEDLEQHSFLAAIKLVKRGIFSVPTRFSDRFKTSGLKNLDLDRNDISFDEGVTSHMPVSREGCCVRSVKPYSHSVTSPYLIRGGEREIEGSIG